MTVAFELFTTIPFLQVEKLDKRVTEMAGFTK